jgi:hypothetical protein
MKFPMLLIAYVLIGLPAANVHAQRAEQEGRVDVQAADYALILPDTIRAGNNRWTFTNTGKMRHEMIIVRLASNVDAKAAVDTLHARGLRAFFPGAADFGVASSGLFSAPGQKSDAELVTHNARGDVLLVFCQLRDGEGKPKHDELGMFKLVHVR